MLTNFCFIDLVTKSTPFKGCFIQHHNVLEVSKLRILLHGQILYFKTRHVDCFIQGIINNAFGLMLIIIMDVMHHLGC